MQAGGRNLSQATLSSTSFDEGFWTRALNELGYPLSVQELDTITLKEQGAIPSGVSPASVKRLYADKYVEVALLSFRGDTTLTRGTSTRIARLWKQKRMMRPLLLFTNGSKSFATVVPGAGTAGEVKVLALAGPLSFDTGPCFLERTPLVAITIPSTNELERYKCATLAIEATALMRLFTHNKVQPSHDLIF
jgi:hypothetical protein